MLLLILFAGCLASCAAQTTSSSFSTSGISTMTPALITEINPSTAATTPNGSANNVVAFFDTAVSTNQEINEATLDFILTQIRLTILQNQPDANFTLTVKNVTRV